MTNVIRCQRLSRRATAAAVADGEADAATALSARLNLAAASAGQSHTTAGSLGQSTMVKHLLRAAVDPVRGNADSPAHTQQDCDQVRRAVDRNVELL